jgi:hypothetical protein
LKINKSSITHPYSESSVSVSKQMCFDEIFASAVSVHRPEQWFKKSNFGQLQYLSKELGLLVFLCYTKETAKEVAKKEAIEKEVVEKEVAEKQATDKEDDDEEEDQSWPSGSSDFDDPVRFPRVKRWFKCPICLNNLYQHKNSLFFHIEYIMMNEFSKPDMVEQNCQLNRLIEAAICDP